MRQSFTFCLLFEFLQKCGSFHPQWQHFIAIALYLFRYIYNGVLPQKVDIIGIFPNLYWSWKYCWGEKKIFDLWIMYEGQWFWPRSRLSNRALRIRSDICTWCILVIGSSAWWFSSSICLKQKFIEWFAFVLFRYFSFAQIVGTLVDRTQWDSWNFSYGIQWHLVPYMINTI